MDSFIEGFAVVIMGVSGAGKSTVGKMMADVMNCSFLDADDFHPQSNKDKMQQGIPLSDEDRIPWLETLRDVLRERILRKEKVVLACSALQNRYREILRSADSNYKLGTYASKVLFILLDAAPEVISSRLEKRAANGEHFMPPTLLKSQLELLKIDESEGVVRIDATLSPEAIINIIKSSIPELFDPEISQNP